VPTFKAYVAEWTYGVFGALPCIAFAAIVAILAVYGLVCISLHVGLWSFPLMAAFVWADGCIRVGRILLLVGPPPSSRCALWGTAFLAMAFFALYAPWIIINVRLWFPLIVCH
jgi:hypothetical protein